MGSWLQNWPLLRIFQALCRHIYGGFGCDKMAGATRAALRSKAEGSLAMHRRNLLLMAGADLMPLPAFAAPAAAQNFVATNIQQGFAILNDKTLSVGERRARFADFLLGITDERRVALFLLGAAASSTAPADIDA